MPMLINYDGILKYVIVRHKTITLLGTSHIAKDSVASINAACAENPTIIAVELDAARLYALEHKLDAKPRLAHIKTLGLGGFLFATFGRYLQKKLGNIAGLAPGSDMLTAARFAKQNSKELVLLDKPIEETLRAISHVSLLEKAKLAKDVLFGMVFKQGPVRSIDLSKVPDDALVAELLVVFRKRYPGLGKALLDDRNKHMARTLHQLMHTRPGCTLLAVVGAGHVISLLHELKTLDRRRDYVHRQA
ncbi:MAG: TraB/GumN family protein [archaeon]